MGTRRGLVFIALLFCSALQGSGSAGGAEKGSNYPFSPSMYPSNTQMVAKRSWTDMAYATVSNAEKLDLYLPSTTFAGPYPLVVYIHGGAFKAGDKAKPYNNGLVAQLLSNGYAVASVNYRLSGEATFPAAVRDVKAAVRWLRAKAALYNLDKSNFAAWGDSAGANLASMLGTSCGVSNLEGPSLGNSGESSCVQAVVDWFGPTDFLQMDAESVANSCTPFHDQPDSPESEYLGVPIQQHPALAAEANPITYVTSSDPPFFIQQGTLDCTVPYQQSQLFYDALKPVIGDANVTLMLLNGWVHEDAQFTATSNVDLVLAFLDKWLK